MSFDHPRLRLSGKMIVVCYAFKLAVGMANDRTTNCFRYGK